MAADFCSFFSSGNSIKLAWTGGGVSVFTSGEVRKNPNPQIMISQRRAASGNGHQTRTSFALEYRMLSVLFVFHRDQKVLCTGGAGAQHRLHDNALRRIAVGGYNQLLF